MEIEKVAAETPELVHKVHIDPGIGLAAFQARGLADAVGLTGSAAGSAASLMRRIPAAFQAVDASLIEINPLVVTVAGQVLALDAKVTLDDNALFRHPELGELRDLAEEACRTKRSSQLWTKRSPSPRHRSTISSARAKPPSKVATGSASPTRKAAAPSPKLRSSSEPGAPMRLSLAMTSTRRAEPAATASAAADSA